MAAWNDLPLHIVALIAQCLAVIEDFTSFSAVSKECLIVTTGLKKTASLRSLCPRYPRLMLAENKNILVRNFVNLETSKTFGVDLPEACGRKCLGAHYGWLFTLGSDLQINLLNPFSRQQIPLPPMLTFPVQYAYNAKVMPQDVINSFVIKVAMSASPLKGNDLNDECVIVAIYGECSILAFARLGDTVWTDIKVPSRAYTDIIFYKGKFYAVDCHGTVFVCDLDDKNSPKATVVAYVPLNDRDDDMQKYLVESSGDLYQVSRVRDVREFEGEDDEKEDSHNDSNEEREERFRTVDFSISRLDESRDDGSDYPYKLTKVTSLGDRALFLGGNVSTSKASSNGIKGNCIYFTDDDVELYAADGGGRNMGIFNMEDGKIDFAYGGKSRSKISPPIWYT